MKTKLYTNVIAATSTAFLAMSGLAQSAVVAFDDFNEYEDYSKGSPKKEITDQNGQGLGWANNWQGVAGWRKFDDPKTSPNGFSFDSGMALLPANSFNDKTKVKGLGRTLSSSVATSGQLWVSFDLQLNYFGDASYTDGQPDVVFILRSGAPDNAWSSGTMVMSIGMRLTSFDPVSNEHESEFFFSVADSNYTKSYVNYYGWGDTPETAGTYINGDKVTFTGVIDYDNNKTAWWVGNAADYDEETGTAIGALFESIYNNTNEINGVTLYKSLGAMELGFDNIEFSVIPEPGVALLGGLGLLTMLRRRR